MQTLTKNRCIVGKLNLFFFFFLLGSMASSLESTNQIFGNPGSASSASAAHVDHVASQSSEETFTNYRWVFPEVLQYPSWFDSQERIDQFLRDYSVAEDEDRSVVLPCLEDDRVCNRVIMQDFFGLALSIVSYDCSFVRRRTDNMVANYLAHFALTDPNHVWIEDVPEGLEPILLLDCSFE